MSDHSKMTLEEIECSIIVIIHEDVRLNQAISYEQVWDHALSNCFRQDRSQIRI